MRQLFAPRGFDKKNAWFAASVCHEQDGRTLFSFWPSEASRGPRVLLEEFGPVKPLERGFLRGT